MEGNDDNKKTASVEATLNEAKVVYKTVSGGLVATLAKNVLQHGIFWIIVYILGLYNFNWKWTVLPLIVSSFIEEGFLKSFSNAKTGKSRGIPFLQSKDNNANTKEKILARIQDLPNWVLFPDFERSEWFNQILDQLWPSLEGFIISKVINDIEPTIQNLSPIAKAITFSKFALGKIPPRIGGIKVYPGKKVVSRNEIILDMNLVWASDCEIRLSAKCNHIHIPTVASVNGISFEGNIRVMLTPLINEPPMFAGMKIAFLQEPKINFSSNGLASIASIPGVSRVINKYIIQQISRICVLPQQLFIPLKNPMPEQIDRCPDPVGILRVEVVQALDLMAKDIRVLQSNTSDPYAVFSLGENGLKFTTKTVDKTLNPVWNEYGEFSIQADDLLEDFNLHINVWDRDTVGADDRLGEAIIPINDLQDRSKQDFWVNLVGDEITSGRVRIITEWLVPSPLYNDYTKLRNESLKRPEISTACLLVYVGHCTDLPGNSPKPSSNVVLSLIGTPDEKSEIRMFTKNPIFRQCFALPIGNPESDDLYINVYDAGPEQDNSKQKPIGNLKIIVSRLLRRSNMEYLSQPFKLNNSGLESTITVSMRLVFMKVCDNAPKENKNQKMMSKQDSISQVLDSQSNDVCDTYINQELTGERESIKRVLSITDKSNKVPKSMSLDSFTQNLVNSEPSLALKLIYAKNESENTSLTSNQTNKNENKLSLTIDKLIDINIPSNCHVYISMLLLPDAKRELKQKTPKVRYTVDMKELTFGSNSFTFPISSDAFKITCIEFKLKSGQTDISGKRMIGKPVTIGRTVVALPDLICDSEGKELDEAVEKIISIHKHKDIKKSGFSSGQGNRNKKLVKSKSTFGKLFTFSSKRNEKSEEEYSSSDSEEDHTSTGTAEDK